MSESLLKKNFQEKDIQRARNLVSGHYGNSTQTLVGYEKQVQSHKEGDVWQEDGKSWTIEDGIKVSVSKLARARKAYHLPLACPRCGKPLSGKLDKKFFPLHGMCYDCLVKFEDDLKRAGLYKNYEKALISNNMQSFVDELKVRMDLMKNDLNVQLVTEEGAVENWGRISDRLIDDVEEWIGLLEDKLNS